MDECEFDLQQCVEKILDRCAMPEIGLPENVFLMISALVPVANVDLLILNAQGEVLLSRRNDSFYDQGWSLVGGCIRYGETFEERIHKTALKEIGEDVKIVFPELAIRNVIRGKQENLKYWRMRGHHIAILFECYLCGDIDIAMQNRKADEDGYLRWFKKMPEDLLKLHHVYDDVFKRYNLL